MIDPITALAGIQAAVSFIKKVQHTVDDVASLGPALGKYFDAKTTATKAVIEAKTSGNKSAMGAAIQIEMALDQAAQFEKQLQLLFMQAGKIDVWNKIKQRAHQMEIEAAKEAKRQQVLAKRKKQQLVEYFEYAFIAVFTILMASGAIWGTFELIKYCTQVGCGR
jgi:hypothetical protein